METDWIRRLKQDDETALCEIIRKYTGYVYTILRNFSHGTLPQEDLVLGNSRNRLRDGSDLAPYLAAIARNGVKNRFRMLGKQPPVRQSYEDLTLSDAKDLCGDAEMVEMIACLLRALDSLCEPDHFQECLRFNVRTGSFSDDTVLFLWRKNLCTCKGISHDRCRGTAPAAPQQRKTPETDDRKGF